MPGCLTEHFYRNTREVISTELALLCYRPLPWLIQAYAVRKFLNLQLNGFSGKE